ncbi:MAG: GtrA family protein [Polyangiaceae bacterium]
MVEDRSHTGLREKWTLARMFELARSLVAGGAATLADLTVLTFCVAAIHLSPQAANVPALIAGGVVNFFGNRHFAFRAHEGSIERHVVGYTLVEVVALAMNGFLYAFVLRAVPQSAHVYWLVRLVTSHIVFLFWSYPLWRKVFRAEAQAV